MAKNRCLITTAFGWILYAVKVILKGTEIFLLWQLNRHYKKTYFSIWYGVFKIWANFGLFHHDTFKISIDQSVDTWISNNCHFDLNYYIKNIIENYLSLLGNHLKAPWNIILTFTLDSMNVLTFPPITATYLEIKPLLSEGARFPDS